MKVRVRKLSIFMFVFVISHWSNDLQHNVKICLDKSITMYNLQFDHNGSFVANGLTVEAVPPESKLFPLDKNLYFDN